jgi:diguanylate cyclase (GGDEF)-like protein
MIFLMDRYGVHLDYKAGFGAEPFVPANEFLGRKLSEVLPSDVAEVILLGVERASEHGDLQSVVYKLTMPDGVHHYEGRIAPCGRKAVVMVVRDITLQKRSDEKILRLAYFDTLTGMPNRECFLEKLDLELLRASRAQRQVALLFLDLDGFKRVNDTFGHSAGDYLLQAVAARLKEKLRASDVVTRPALEEGGVHLARLGGDEFTIVLPDLESTQTVSMVAERLQALLTRPFRISSQDITVSASIGIAIFPEDGDDAATLLKHAHTAMYHAKDQGRNNWQRYDRSLTAETMVRIRLENDLRKGLQRDEFRLFYQPAGQRRRRQHRRPRGTDSLAAPGRRPGLAGTVHSCRRRQWPDRGPRRLGAAHRLPSVAQLAGDGSGDATGGGERFGPPVAHARLSGLG